MALDNRRSVYEIAIEIGGKLKQSLGTATSGANKKLSGLAVYADKTARATTSLSKAINGMMLVKGVSWVSGHMISIGKSAIAAASEMETYRTTLNTVLRDEEKAADMMRWATDFAAHTPYNTGDIVDAVTRLEAYGFKSQVMLENIGNMASAMNKDLPTAVEAVYKATLGEMELMENNFAITKKLINEKAQEWYGQSVIDASKKITDTEMYTNTLLRLIEEKFEGGMEAQSRTWAGIKSNMEDSRDAIFRRIVGMDAAGEATENGLYGRLIRMGQRAADEIGEFADSEVLDDWASKIGEVWDYLQTDVIPDFSTGATAFATGLKDAYTSADELFQKLSGGKTIVEGFAGAFDSVIAKGIPKFLEHGGAALRDLGDMFTEYSEGDTIGATKKGASAANNLLKGIVGEDNLISSAAGQMADDVKNFFAIIGERAQSLGLYAPVPGATNPYIEVNVTAAPTDNAYTLGDTIAERVKAAIAETNHQTARVSLRPNKMQTAH
jgi:hypothetical protein